MHSKDSKVCDNFIETIFEDYKIYIEGAEKLSEFNSPFQKVEIINTKSLGRVFRLDDYNMTSEADEFLYHEPMNHIALLAQDNPRNVLIIGGGDGGSVDEVLKHPSIEKIVLVELDSEVIRISRESFSKVHNDAFSHPKLEIVIEDGFVWLPKAHSLGQQFDLVVMDLTDPIGPAESLYSDKFFELINAVLSKNGCMSLHIGHTFFHQQRFVDSVLRLRKIFKFVCPFHVAIPLYGGDWGMAIVSPSINVSETSEEVFAKRISERKLENLQWLNAKCLKAAFALPNYLLKSIDNN